MPKKRPEELARIKVSLPTSLVAQLNLQFFDPVYGKPQYGKRSALIERLLRDWLKGQQSGRERRSERGKD